MVIGLLALTSIPTITGIGNAVSAQKRQDASLSKEQEKFHLTAMVPRDGELREVAFCVLADGKIYLDFPQRPVAGAHRFCGYYFQYPCEERHRGLVSTVSDDPPMLNWIFVDAETRALRYGARSDTLGHVIGPWAWTPDEHFLVLRDDPSSFVARPDSDGRWAVYWVGPEDGPQDAEGHHGGGSPSMAIRLRRRMLLGMESSYVRA